MSSGENSKYSAMQSGVIIAVIVILIIMMFNWYKEYSYSCVSRCADKHRWRREVDYNPGCRYPRTHCSCAYCVAYRQREYATDMVAGGPMKEIERSDRFVPIMDKRVTESSLEMFLNGADNYNTYSDDLIEPVQEGFDPAKMSLEKSVYDSHRQFVNDELVTLGPDSSLSEMSHCFDINPRVGLRPINYDVPVSSDARVVTSEYSDQFCKRTSTYTI